MDVRGVSRTRKLSAGLFLYYLENEVRLHRQGDGSSVLCQMLAFFFYWHQVSFTHAQHQDRATGHVDR